MYFGSRNTTIEVMLVLSGSYYEAYDFVVPCLREEYLSLGYKLLATTFNMHRLSLEMIVTVMAAKW